MGMTMTQKIFARHCGAESVAAGDLINARLDLVMGINTKTTAVRLIPAIGKKAGETLNFGRDQQDLVWKSC